MVYLVQRVRFDGSAQLSPRQWYRTECLSSEKLLFHSSSSPDVSQPSGLLLAADVPLLQFWHIVTLTCKQIENCRNLFAAKIHFWD